jgi:response regulator RpfG family c-di-GMP phosphodiesterase/HAMP domain-containing protein
MKWYQSLKTHIAAALIFQLMLVVAMTIFSGYELSLRKHDYAVLNLAGQLRVTAQDLVSQSQNYKIMAPRDYESYQRDLAFYHKNIQKQIKTYSDIISNFENRRLTSEVTGQAETIYCNWDEQSIMQLNKTAINWRKFEAGLIRAIGENKLEPRLEYAAEYTIENATGLTKNTNLLVSSFQKMMETKLDTISQLNILSIVVFIFINIVILWLFFKKVFEPLDAARITFKSVENGNLDCKIDINSSNEIGLLSESFNHLTQRLASLFRLTEHIHQAINLDESLAFFHEEFRSFFPIEWVGMLRRSPASNQFTLERIYSDVQCHIYENEKFDNNDPLLLEAVSKQQPITHNQLKTKSDSLLLTKLLQCDLASVLSLPMDCLNNDVIILIIAAKQEDAYLPKHMELLANLKNQLSHSIDKTIGMEGLVISAIEGLAKLAESRDPETGDHLTRMSMYSAIIAEQLAKTPAYSERINSAYIRNILRFAPMHDIGKVGIEDSILLKPGKLSSEERTEMENHPMIGSKVLQRCELQMNAVGRSIFKMGIEITECHHEKYDGSGYPAKLKGTAIPLSARIVAVADVFDALTSKRPYKEAWSVEKAMQVMHESTGKHFDPDVIDALDNAMDKVMNVYNEHKHI